MSGFWFASDACKNPTGGSKIAAWIASEEVCDKFGSCEKGGSCSAPATTVKADCTTPATWTNGEVLEDVHEDEATCDAGTWAKYGLVVQLPCTQAQLDKDECMCNHNGEKKKANIFTEGDEPKACWALQGPPQAVGMAPRLLRVLPPYPHFSFRAAAIVVMQQNSCDIWILGSTCLQDTAAYAMCQLAFRPTLTHDAASCSRCTSCPCAKCTTKNPAAHRSTMQRPSGLTRRWSMLLTGRSYAPHLNCLVCQTA
jgi:hypothetical protein